MKTTLKRFTLFFLIAIIGISQMGCFGKFGLVRAVYKINGSPDNKFVKSVLTWVFVILPVYAIAGFLDFILFNLIEFWSGSNPIAMKPGEKETQMVAWHGNQYQITATQNRFHIEQLTGDDKGKVNDLVYNPKDKSWSAIAENQTVKLVSFSETKDHQELVTFYKPDGRTTTVLASESVASVQEKLGTVYAMK